jgi:hypothetical protein
LRQVLPIGYRRFAGGRQCDPREYTASEGAITWAGSDQPSEILAKISLTKDLSESDRERLVLEREKVVLEGQNFASEKRWRWITAAGAVARALLTFLGTSYLMPLIFPTRGPVKTPVVPQTTATVANKLPDESGDQFLTS